MSHDQSHTHEPSLSPRRSLPTPVRLGLVLVLLSVALILIPAQIARADGPVVNTLDDHNDPAGCTIGDCTLREAILDPTADQGITFGVTGTITWTEGKLWITKTIVITGPGPNDMTIWGDESRFISAWENITVAISGITFQHFDHDFWGGALNIIDGATLIVDNCVFRDNQTDGTTLLRSYGGAISGRRDTTLIIQNSLFDNNRAVNDHGGAIASYHPNEGAAPIVIISNSTFTGNSARYSGGAIFCHNCDLRVDSSTIFSNTATFGGGIANQSDEAIAKLNVTNSTISGNHADDSGGGFYNITVSTAYITNTTISHNDAITSGGGIYNPTDPMSVTNSIVANNTSVNGPNCLGTPVSHGYNLESGTDCGFTATGDQQSTDPLLGPIQDNNGPTWTRALPFDSPAVEAGNCNGATADQRGKPRPTDLPGFAIDLYDSCDIGACEIQLDAVTAPPPNSHTHPPTTTISITYGEPISPTTVTSRTFAVHAMQTGLVAAAHSVNGNTIVATSDRVLHAGELVQTTATTGTLNVDGAQPSSPTVWQFRAAVQGGSGDFDAHPIRPTFGANDSYSIALGDMDGDGDLDAVIANDGAEQQVWLNDGNGNFGAAAIDVVGSGDSRSVVLGDLDGDGDLDAIAANYGAAQEVYENDGNGGLEPNSDGTGFGTGDTHDIALGDVDGDGDLDAVVANDGTAQQVWLNDGNGNFGGAAHDTFGAGDSRGIALGDVDGDGDLDAVIANYGTAQKVWLNDGSGNFGATVFDTFGSDNSQDIALGDVDGDGDLDAVVANNSVAQKVYLNDGTGNFATFSTFGNGNSHSVALGDVDNDGDLDAVIANHNAKQNVYLNDGSGNFATFDTFDDASSASNAVALGDVDGDGDLDAVVANYGTAQETWLNRSGTNLSIAKWVTPSIATLNSTITYTIIFSNSGSETATRITITDTVPSSVTVSSVVSSGVAISQVNPGYVWYVHTLLPGQVGVITITGELGDLSHDDTFTNTAEISGIIVETTLDDNNDDAPITIDDDPPLPPVLISPFHNTPISDTAPTLNWNPSATAVGYMLDFNNAITDVGNTTAYTTGVLADGGYTWTVAAYDAPGNTSLYTDVWSFTLDNTPPDAPVLSSPEDNSFINILTPTLSWNVDTDAVGYILDFDSTFIDVGDTTFSTTGVLTDGVYVWTVAAYDALRNVGDYAGDWSFTVDTVPPRVETSAPSDGTSDIPRNALIVANFDEAMDTGNVDYIITPATTLTSTWGIGDDRLTLTHDEFAASTRYTVTVNAGSDPAGNPLTNAPYTWVFTTSAISLPEVDLALGKERDGEGDVIVGETITYTFTITNLGPTTPVTATIVDTFNDPAALASVSGEGCVWLGAKAVTCTVTDIITGSPSVLTLVVLTNNGINGTLGTAIFSGAVINIARVTPAGQVIDTQPGNDDAGPVTVIVHPNQPPVAVVGDQAEHINTTITLDGGGSYDPDGHIPLTYGWTQTGGAPVFLNNSATSQPTFSAPNTPDILTFDLLVTDTLGVVGEPDTLVVTITDWRLYLPIVIRASHKLP